MEKRGRNLVYRRSALDAFLRENGTDMWVWIERIYRDAADHLQSSRSNVPISNSAAHQDARRGTRSTRTRPSSRGLKTVPGPASSSPPAMRSALRRYASEM